ncbi:MAG: DUF4139 domain-containing protein [Rhodospirillaceae bacterium]|nr:MAG: DUF4139 domain-containing protein [Rhodospirillaceae bacterium]
MRSNFLAATALISGLAVAGLAGGTASADETAVTPEQQTSVAVTIYNNDLALIRDSRKVTLAQGENDLAFIDVSGGMRPETALLTAKDAQLSVIEQNFDFDLLTSQKILEKSVGQKIRVIRTNPETGADTSEDATVLSVADGSVVLQIGDRIETAAPGRLAFSAVPANLRARPTLVVKLNSPQAGEVPVVLSYLSRGLSWSADYVAELTPDEKTINLNGWVTLTNQSGITYKDAKLQLVAGNVNQVQQEFARPLNMSAAATDMMPAPKMREQAAFEYHLYSLDRPTTIKENQTKQVALLDAAGIPVTKTYLFENLSQRYGSYFDRNAADPKRVNASVRVKFDNTEAAKLGMPLPQGTMRVYKADDTGEAIFVGEDHIDHTPKNEHVDLTLGEAFDITARAKQVSFEKISDKVYESSYEIELKNAKKEAITATLREVLPGQWKMLDESAKHEQVNAQTAQWQVQVPAEGSAKLTYKVRISM